MLRVTITMLSINKFVQILYEIWPDHEILSITVSQNYGLDLGCWWLSVVCDAPHAMCNDHVKV